MSEYCKNCEILIDGLETIAALSADTSNDSCERKQLLDDVYEHTQWLMEQIANPQTPGEAIDALVEEE